MLDVCSFGLKHENDLLQFFFNFPASPALKQSLSAMSSANEQRVFVSLKENVCQCDEHNGETIHRLHQSDFLSEMTCRITRSINYRAQSSGVAGHKV